jgi:hypothetical protein
MTLGTTTSTMAIDEDDIITVTASESNFNSAVTVTSRLLAGSGVTMPVGGSGSDENSRLRYETIRDVLCLVSDSGGSTAANATEGTP